MVGAIDRIAVLVTSRKLFFTEQQWRLLQPFQSNEEIALITRPSDDSCLDARECKQLPALVQGVIS